MSRNTKRFISGDWVGYYTLNGKRKDVTLQLRFLSGGKVEGNGSDDFGFFEITGEYNPSPPYTAKLIRKDYSDQERVIEYSGFRESETDGLFGQWKGQGNGDFHFKPTKGDDAAVKRLQESARKSKLEQLLNMGFPKYLCELALQQQPPNATDLTAAIDFITRQISAGAADDFGGGDVEGGGGGGGSTSNLGGGGGGGGGGDSSDFTFISVAGEASQEAIQQLTEMGFSVDQAKLALSANDNNVQQALEWLFSNSG